MDSRLLIQLIIFAFYPMTVLHEYWWFEVKIVQVLYKIDSVPGF